MSKKTMVLEMICLSGLSMLAPDHCANGALTDGNAVGTIIDNADVIETGYIQGQTDDEIKGRIKTAIVVRNLSTLIDIWKEICAAEKQRTGIFDNFIISTLREAGYCTDCGYLARDGNLIMEGHIQIASTESVQQLVARANRIYGAIVNEGNELHDRMERIREFISLLITAPHIQRSVLNGCLTTAVVERLLDGMSRSDRITALEKILEGMVTGDLYKGEGQPVVPEIKVEDPVEPEDQYLHFTGRNHLLGGTHQHGTLTVELPIFHSMIQSTAEGTVLQRAIEAISYIHRSEHQRGLCGFIFRELEMEKLDNLNDPRLRAVMVEDQIISIITTGTSNTSIYNHPARGAAKKIENVKKALDNQPQIDQPVADHHPNPGYLEQILKELASITGVSNQELLGKMKEIRQPLLTQGALAHQGSRAHQLLTSILGSISEATGTELSPGQATEHLMSVFGEPARRVQASGIDVTGYRYQKPTPTPMEISGGSQELRLQMAAMFDQLGVEYIFTDEQQQPKFEDHSRLFTGAYHGVQWQMVYNPLARVATITPRIGTRPAGSIGFDVMPENLEALWNLVSKAVTTESPRKYLMEHCGSIGAKLSREVAVTML